MTWLLEFIKSIGSVIGALLNFFINTLESLIRLFLSIPKIVEMFMSYLLLLPEFITIFALIYLSILVAQFLANRRAE